MCVYVRLLRRHGTSRVVASERASSTGVTRSSGGGGGEGEEEEEEEEEEDLILSFSLPAAE